MAIAIRSIPTLFGEDADRFIQKAQAAEKNEHKKDISKNILMVKDFLRKQNF